MDYTLLKLLHVAAAGASVCGFVARGLGILAGGGWVRLRLARILPHVIDTILLLCALGMLWVGRLSPWELPWLQAKSVGLVVYVVLGIIALRTLRHARTPRARAAGVSAFVAALAVFAFIVSVAITKNPRGVLVYATPGPATPCVPFV
ncbi:MAG TPA: SirB2 family protein [Steroidobacteraceae bacterium]|nr:SirB2 family protein [Steroidobacteraceae bacterium]